MQLGDDFDADLKENQQAQKPSEELEGRKRTLTQKGFEYQLPFKKKNYQEALVKLRNCVDRVDMSWTDAKDTSGLRQMRIELEENRQALEKARVEFAPFVSGEEFQLLNSELSDIMKQAVDLRKNIGERSFTLEKDEIRSRPSVKTSSSKKSSLSQASEFRAKAVAEAARRKVEWQYAKLETQKMIELKMKECEIKEMKKKKDYESAEAEAIALAKVKEEEEDNFPPDSLDNIPAVIDSDDRVRQYLSTLPINSVHSSTPVSSSAGQTPVSAANAKSPAAPTTKPNQSPDLPVMDDGSPGTRPSKRKPTATPFTPVYTHAAMPTFSTPFYPAVDQHGMSQAITESFLAARMPPRNLQFLVETHWLGQHGGVPLKLLLRKELLILVKRFCTFFSICLVLQERL